MPEYHNLQAYARFDEATFDDILARYRAVLGDVGCMDARVEAWLGEVRWNAHGGFVSGGTVEAGMEIESAGVRLLVRPHVIGFAPGSLGADDGGWMEYGLLFETERIERQAEPDRWTYRDGLGPALWALMERFGAAFPELGTFFTDEAQDGRPFEGFLRSTRDRWCFDLARISPAAAAAFAAEPPGFFRAEAGGALALARRRAWTEPPWTP